MLIEHGFDRRHEAIITVTVGLPMTYAGILASPLANTADFSSLRLCVYAMAPMPASLVGKIANKMSRNIMLATGQTESYPITNHELSLARKSRA